jgi:hypothetical protein
MHLRLSYKTSPLKMCKNKIALCSENNIKHINLAASFIQPFSKIKCAYTVESKNVIYILQTSFVRQGSRI